MENIAARRRRCVRKFLFNKNLRTNMNFCNIDAFRG
jgi:hypothetical protein